MAYLAYLAFMFSSLGASMFTQLTFLEILIPAIWFFYFLLRFARQQTQGYFLGVTLSVMVLISSYLPFYFLSMFLCFLSAYMFLYTKDASNFCVDLFCFIQKHWRLSLLCTIGIILAAAPITAYKILDASGNVVAPGRHCQYSSAQECYERTMGRQGGMTYDEITRSGSLGERLDMQYLFGNLDKISYGSDSLFFIPVWIYMLLALSLFLPLRRLTVLLSATAVLVGLIALGQSSGLFGVLFRHIPFFAYFRNLFFLGAFLIPLMILLGLYQLQMLWGISFKDTMNGVSTKRKVTIVSVVVVHAALFLFLKHFESVPRATFVTLGLSLAVFIVYFSGLVRFSNRAWGAIFAFLIVLEPTWVLKAYAFNAQEFATVLPSMHVNPVFSWQRPLIPAVAQGRIYQFVHYEDFWYDMSMTDAPPKVGYPQSVTRWTFDLSQHTSPKAIEGYARYKIIVYDASHPSGQPVLGPSPQMDVIYFDVNTLKLKVHFNSTSVLVYNDSYTTSWKAYLDGAPVELIRANEAFKGIKVPAGEHFIEFSYHPPGGSWVFLAATVALFIFLIWASIMLYLKL